MVKLHSSNTGGFSLGRTPLVAALLCAGLLGAAPSYAATFTVNSTADAQDTNPGDGICETAPGNGVCTLRAAFNEANALGFANSIMVPTGTYGLTIGFLGTTTSTNNLTVTGTGAVGSVIIDAGALSQVLNLQGGVTTLSNLTIQNGKFTLGGGGGGACAGSGILVANSTVNVLSSEISGNVVVNGTGAGICVAGTGVLNLDNSSVQNNTAEQGGGGIRIMAGASANISKSAIYNNHLTMAGNGDAAGIETQGTLVISDSTISGNTQSAVFGSGTGISVTGGSTSLTNVTISNNSGGAPQLASLGGTVNVVNSIIANPAVGTNCSAGIASGGHNIESANSCGFVASGDLINTNPLLGPLANNGGSTMTHALLAGSPAIDAGTNGSCGPTDQRGVVRPQGATCDIGAFEKATIANNPPVAANDSYITPFNTPLTVPQASGVLANDSDPDGNAITAVLSVSPTHGTLALNANGGFVYTPTAGYSGPDSFTYFANDGTVNSISAATVSITVTAVANTPPVATNDSYSVMTGNTPNLTVSAPGVLANDSDPDGNAITAVLNAGPAHGTLMLNANGGFVYTPTPGYSGPDSFTYYAFDGMANSTSAATVSIAVSGGVITPPDTTPAIVALTIPPSCGLGSMPAIVNLSLEEGPAFAADMVGIFSNAVGQALVYLEQSACGTVTLSGFNAGKLAFIPHTFQSEDPRANGIYPMGNGQYQVVRNTQSLVIAPALVHLEQITALLPGVAAKQVDNGVMTASFNGLTYVVQASAPVQLDAPMGSAQLLQGGDGYFHFIDALGHNQVLYPAFADPATLRSVLLGLDPGATLTIELGGTASIVLNGQHYTLVADLTLGDIPAERVGQSWWQESATRYRVINAQLLGTSQGFTVKPCGAGACGW